jgi:hypothetical protein
MSSDTLYEVAPADAPQLKLKDLTPWLTASAVGTGGMLGAGGAEPPPPPPPPQLASTAAPEMTKARAKRGQNLEYLSAENMIALKWDRDENRTA